MKTKSLFLLLAAFALPVQALDFTPRYREITTEGGSVSRRLYFADGAKAYTLFAGTTSNMTSDANTLRFTFDDLEGSSLSFRLSPLSPELPFEGEALEKYREALSSFLPSGVSDVTVEEEGSYPAPISDWKSHRFIVKCKLPGSTLRVSVIFLNLDEKRQVVLVTTAYDEVFKKAQERSGDIIRSWQPITEQELAIPEAS